MSENSDVLSPAPVTSLFYPTLQSHGRFEPEKASLTYADCINIARPLAPTARVLGYPQVHALQLGQELYASPSLLAHSITYTQAIQYQTNVSFLERHVYLLEQTVLYLTARIGSLEAYPLPPPVYRHQLCLVLTTPAHKNPTHNPPLTNHKIYVPTTNDGVP